PRRPPDSATNDSRAARASGPRAFSAAIPAAVAALLAACTADEPPQPWQPRTVRHDFGMIPHGTAATARLEIDFPQDRGAIVPLGFRGPCACATWRFVAIGKDGRERVSYGQPTAEHAVLPGDRLLLELTIDTRQKEAAQQQVLTNSGEALLVDLAN